MMIDSSNKETQPLVSIVIPAYNAERWIELTLDSARQQTHGNIEILVIDDGSTDRTPELVEAAAARDPRVSLYRQANAGVGAARNHGIRRAKGRYIAPLDADDLWKPEKIERQVARFAEGEAKGENLGLVYSWSRSIDEAGNSMRSGLRRRVIEGEVFDHLLGEHFVGNGSSPLFLASALGEVGAYNECMLPGCADWDQSVRVANRYRFGVVQSFDIGYRQVGNSMSKSFDRMITSHEEMLASAVSCRPEIEAWKIRNSRSALLLWLVILAKPFKKGFFPMLQKLLWNDPLICFRKMFWRYIFSCLRYIVMGLSKKSVSAGGKPFLED